VAWEQERLQIMRNQEMHAELVRRVDAEPMVEDERFQRAALVLKADAQIELGDPQAARATVRELLWFRNMDTESGELKRLRRLVMHSYLLEDRIEDAQLALVRYRQDFGDENSDWRWLSAAVALRSGHAGSVFKLLAQDDSVQGRLLRYAAELEVEPEKAAEIEAAAVRQAEETSGPGLQRALWGLAARAAGQAGKPAEEILYLERALSVVSDDEFVNLQLNLTADRLWSAYQSLGQKIGNQEQRLLGKDEDWYFPATEAMTSDPLRARVLFAVLAEHGSDQEHRTLAHEYLVDSLDDLPHGGTLVKQLYLASGKFENVENIPQVIRYRLVDDALQEGQLQTASRLMDGLAAPPAGGDRFEWDLRRARVNIFTGRVDTGVELLAQLLVGDAQQWAPARVDRLLQVVFDLQAMGKHVQALEILEALAKKQLESRQMRELLFWMADSHQALAEYESAAFLYLNSAAYLDPLAMDPWAQTARYQAAKALAEAGLVGDARRIFTSLLHATRDASRKAVLENEIQRLWLVRDAGEAGG
jgi:tetratricopeptide (TPR) repeat protein